MNENMKPKDPSSQGPEPLVITELGVASKLTRGSALITPWLELGIAPYNHWLPHG